jgi:uncharacterized protein (DUF3820 family)
MAGARRLPSFWRKTMTNPIVPFGKYKDQPIEVLQSDKQYLDWLLAQGWFKDRYHDLFTIVINNFQEPSDTPEHNAMHVKFLNDDYVYRLLSPVVGFTKPGRVASKKFECDGWDVFVVLSNITTKEHEQLVKTTEELSGCGSLPKAIGDNWACKDAVIANEKNNAEIDMLWKAVKVAGVYLELKPTVSDDFPAILRQMKATKMAQARQCDIRKMVLLVGEYNGKGATRDEFVAFMKNEGIVVLFAE